MKSQTRMSPGRGVKEGAVLLGGILFAFGAGILYQKLTERQIGAGVFTYSLSYTIPVMLCAAAAYTIAALHIRRIVGERMDSFEEDAVVESEEAEWAEGISDDVEYELLKPQEEESVPTAAQQRAEKIASVFAAQRVVQVDLPPKEESYGEEDDAWDALYRAPESTEDAAVRKMYEDLPLKLPEGYELPDQAEEEQEDFWEDEDLEELSPRSLFWEVFPILCVALVFVLVLLFTASFWTKAGDDGIWVSRFGKVRAYTWDQVTAYTVDVGFAGGEIKLIFQMSDGRQVKISPASCAETGMFSDQYENLYQYWLHADNMLSAAGADKTVVQKQYLADTYMSDDDSIWRYVREIIEYEEDPWQKN